MIEFRLKVPAERRRDAEFIAHQEATVREHLSRCCSPADGLELVDQVEISRRASREGGFWLHGALDAPVVDTAPEVDPAEYADCRRARCDADAVTDLDVSELLPHMVKKGARS